MSIDKVKAYLKVYGKDQAIVVHAASTATVEEAAAAFGVPGAQIAKSLTFKGEETPAVMIVFAGDARVDNHKFKMLFHRKASMLPAEDVVRYTGYEVGGVCPFAIPDNAHVSIYLDISLKRFDTVYPACGSDHSGIPLAPEELFVISQAIGWIDAGKGWQNDSAVQEDK